MRAYKKQILMGLLFLLILIIGAIGYGLLLHVSALDALYMTVITISTVGYREVAVMTPAAKLFTIVLIFASLSFVGYLFTNLVSFFVKVNIMDSIRFRRLKNQMQSIQDHYILCGAGETGGHAIVQLIGNKVQFVVIDKNKQRVDDLLKRGIMAICGDATDQNILIEAGIKRARGLLSYLNQDIYIISRSIESSAHEKLLRAGANRTISPTEIGGRRMAALMLRPAVVSFLDLINNVGNYVLDIEDVMIRDGSELSDKPLKEAQIRDRTGLILMAMQKKDSTQMIFNPGPEELLQTGDSMIVLGTIEQVQALRGMAKDI
jgi:voltage-gated potassium channel